MGVSGLTEFLPISSTAHLLIGSHLLGFADPGGLFTVMIQFGAGKVNFGGVFAVLKAAGFDGPIMVECCKVGATAEATTENARANRLFLEKILATI